MKLNKPDNVVYNEDLAIYDASLKTYGTMSVLLLFLLLIWFLGKTEI